MAMSEAEVIRMRRHIDGEARDAYAWDDGSYPPETRYPELARAIERRRDLGRITDDEEAALLAYLDEQFPGCGEEVVEVRVPWDDRLSRAQSIMENPPEHPRLPGYFATRLEFTGAGRFDEQSRSFPEAKVTVFYKKRPPARPG
jgi:hypothetical protein